MSSRSSTTMLCYQLLMSLCVMLGLSLVCEAITTEVPTPEPTLKPTLGPDDLTTTDIIIISVTSVVFCGVLVGGIVFGCQASKKEEKAQQELYDEYLKKDQFGGRTNQAYS